MRFVGRLGASGDPSLNRTVGRGTIPGQRTDGPRNRMPVKAVRERSGGATRFHRPARSRPAVAASPDRSLPASAGRASGGMALVAGSRIMD